LRSGGGGSENSRKPQQGFVWLAEEAVPATLAATRKTYRRNLGPQSKWVNRTNFLRSQPSLRRLSNEALVASEGDHSRPFRSLKDAFCWSDQPLRGSGPPVVTDRCAGSWWSAPPLDAPSDTPESLGVFGVF
jgi:hypothetical protein